MTDKMIENVGNTLDTMLGNLESLTESVKYAKRALDALKFAQKSAVEERNVQIELMSQSFLVGANNVGALSELCNRALNANVEDAGRYAQNIVDLVNDYEELFKSEEE